MRILCVLTLETSGRVSFAAVHTIPHLDVRVSEMGYPGGVELLSVDWKAGVGRTIWVPGWGSETPQCEVL